jgi:hypothetical protein
MLSRDVPDAPRTLSIGRSEDHRCGDKKKWAGKKRAKKTDGI